MDLIRRLQRLNDPDPTFEHSVHRDFFHAAALAQSRMVEWLEAMDLAAPHLNIDLQEAKSTKGRAELGRKMLSAYKAIREWSIANGYGSIARDAYDEIINVLETMIAEEGEIP